MNFTEKFSALRVNVLECKNIKSQYHEGGDAISTKDNGRRNDHY